MLYIYCLSIIYRDLGQSTILLTYSMQISAYVNSLRRISNSLKASNSIPRASEISFGMSIFRHNVRDIVFFDHPDVSVIVRSHQIVQHLPSPINQMVKCCRSLNFRSRFLTMIHQIENLLCHKSNWHNYGSVKFTLDSSASRI